nr:MAG TPA: hypothetical protein [Caudoviricetes sp.]
MCYDVIKGTQRSMLNTVAVDSEQCVVGATIPSWWYATSIAYEGVHTTHNTQRRHTHTTQGRVLCYVRARRAARALHNTRHSTNEKKKKRRKARTEKREENKSSVRRWRRSSRSRCDAPPPNTNNRKEEETR